MLPGEHRDLEMKFRDTKQVDKAQYHNIMKALLIDLAIAHLAQWLERWSYEP